MQTYAVVVPINHNWTVSFPEHLAQLRKERGFTQPQLAEKVGLHTLDVIRGLAVALGVSADELLFAKNERGPDDTLKLQFEAVSRFTTEEKHVVKSLLEGMILQHEARRWAER
jgi:transcriptional regulator with XRE-family HTH domain